MKKIYFAPTLKSIKFRKMLMSSSAPTNLHDEEVEFEEVLSKGFFKGDDFWGE